MQFSRHVLPFLYDIRYMSIKVSFLSVILMACRNIFCIIPFWIIFASFPFIVSSASQSGVELTALKTDLLKLSVLAFLACIYFFVVSLLIFVYLLFLNYKYRYIEPIQLYGGNVIGGKIVANDFQFKTRNKGQWLNRFEK